VVALFPLLLVFCKFFVVITVVTGFIADVPQPRRDAAAAQPPRGRLLKSRLQQRRLAEPCPALHHPNEPSPRPAAASSSRISANSPCRPQHGRMSFMISPGRADG